MSFMFEELDYRPTPIGDLMLRRRRMPQFGSEDIYEVKLGDHFLMTSLFHEAESRLAALGLAACPDDELNVVVGGLGLGYTAQAALEDPRVNSLTIVEYLDAVIHWHESGLVPLGPELAGDPRCRFRHDDFFALASDTSRHFDPTDPALLHDAILLDIDHTPTHVLHQTNARFYTPEGLAELKQHLKPDGIFALWADGAPEEPFTEQLRSAFYSAEAHTIEFDNPITGATSVGAVYVAHNDGSQGLS